MRRPLLAAAAKASGASVGWLVAAVGLKLGVEFLKIPQFENWQFEDWIARVTNVLLAVAAGYVFYRLVDVIDAWVFRINEKNPSRLDDMLTTLLRASMRRRFSCSCSFK